MAKSAAEIFKSYEQDLWNAKHNNSGNAQYQAEDYALEQALKQLHEGVIEGLPKKQESTMEDYKDTIDGIGSESAEMLINYRIGYSRALDDVTKYLKEYFGRQE